MNKKVLVTLLLTAMFGKMYADSCSTCPPCKMICPLSQCRATAVNISHFNVRPEFQAGMPERTTLFHDRMLARQDGRGGAIQIVPFGGRSTRTSDLAGYFSLYGLPVLSVSENVLADSGLVDILANHFNIYTNGCNIGSQNLSCFASQICFEPQRSVAGLGFNYRHGFARRDDGRGFFFEISFPVEKVTTTMHLGETIINDGDGAYTCDTENVITNVSGCPIPSAQTLSGSYTPPVGSMCEAFQQPAWAFGRIENGSSRNERTGVADVDLLIGYDLVHSDQCYMRSYAGILAPTGNKPDGVLMFQPIVGHEKHTAIRYGGTFSLELWHHHTKERAIWFDFQSEFFFFLSNHQMRTFDVKNKPWSRYMQVYSSINQLLEAFNTTNQYLHTPGVNVFTQEVKVDPGTARTYQSALIFNNESFQGELGYTFYARPAECVELTCEFPQGIAFKAINGLAGFVNRVQQIGNVFEDANSFNVAANISSEPTAYEDRTVGIGDLDFNSAAHPAMLTYIIYASMGNRWDDREYPLFIGGGGSYEFSKDNTGMTRWLLWAKVGFSF